MRLFFGKKKKEESESYIKVGGIAFFISLLFLSIVAIINALFILLHLTDLSLSNLLWFFLGALPGFVVSSTLLSGRTAVFIHELKHSIISNLAGNRAKGMNIRSTHGHFEYEYTERTAAYNAFIALAPYWFPLFTIVTLPISLLFFQKSPALVIALTSLAYGIDQFHNMRDVSPYQTDFSMIRGGFTVGLLYVSAMNLALLSILLIWILGDLAGLKDLALFWWKIGLTLQGMLR